MARVKDVKEALRKQMERDRPLLDQEKTRLELLDWIAQINFPGTDNPDGWQESLHQFPAEPGDQDADNGIRVRFGIKFHTTHNSYLLSILELLDVSSRGVYILTVHVNWDQNEKKMQEALEQLYVGSFDDIYRSRHVIWVQNFRENELQAALGAASLAMIGNELTETKKQDGIGTPMKHPIRTKIELPYSESEQETKATETKES